VGPMALEARAVSKRYGNRAALCDVDLVAVPGRLHGLLGPNGAGKTTLMRVLLGLVRADSGDVHLLGRPLLSTSGPVPDGVAGLVEAPAFYPYLSGRTNLALLARLDWSSPRATEANINTILEEVGLATRADRAVEGYSAGMRQRLGLAGALLRAPRLLLLDEPTSALDPGGARDVRAVLMRLADSGTAVVLSSHDMIEVEELCDSLTILHHGSVVFSGTVEELRRRAPDAVHLMRTSDDAGAVSMAVAHTGVQVVPGGGGGLEICAGTTALDAYVIALGARGIAVRALERRARSLETIFLQHTGDSVAAAPAARDETAETGSTSWGRG
jgi:ABC-2 type transport system ATP-binding protein